MSTYILTADTLFDAQQRKAPGSEDGLSSDTMHILTVLKEL